MTSPQASHAERSVIAIECNGARASIELSPPELLREISTRSLPLGWSPTTPAADDPMFNLAANDDGTYAVGLGPHAVSPDGETTTQHPYLEQALEILRSRLFMHVLSTPSGRVFVHAGCVAHHGAAILLPGYAGAGKTTLVAALVRAGAAYYTDDYAPLDENGFVHPYPLPLWQADPQTGLEGPRAAEDLGGTVGEQPLPVAVVAHLLFPKDGHWDVRRCRESEGMMLLLQHTLNSQRQPEFALSAMRGAASEALVLQGERGDAEEAAAKLLALAQNHDQRVPS
jgi:hypothetical protein